MITLLKNADRVHAASLAQLVNVIAPIMTEPGGPAWRQTTFYPFSLTAKLAKGGTVLEPKLASGTYETDKYGEVPTINSVAVRGEDGTISVFVVNRSMEAANDFAIKLPEGFALPRSRRKPCTRMICWQKTRWKTRTESFCTPTPPSRPTPIPALCV